MKLSFAQKVLKWLTSETTFEKFRLESMRYKFDCTCGKTSDIWEIGGVRYKATANKRTWIKCPGCGKGKMRTIYKV
jgi:Zn finger protein HypA/HybF involved in hydrogenase expression